MVGVEWVLTAVALGVMAAGVAGSMARVSRRAAAWQDRIEAIWREVAERVGGELAVGARRSVAPRHLAIVLAREDAIGVVEVNAPVDPSAPSHTRAHARFALGHGPVFRVWDPEPGERMGTVVLPEPLARRFRCDSPDEVATRAAFTPAAWTHLLAFGRAVDLRSNGEMVELTWHGVELDPDTLVHALGVVAELAQTGVAALRSLATLDGAEYVPVVDGGPAVRLHRERVDVELVVEPSSLGPRCAARTALQRALDPLTVGIDERGLLDGEVPAGVIEPEAHPLLAQLGASTLSIGAEDVRLTWITEPALGQAEAGARLVALVAAGTGRRGAFR